LWGGSAGRDNRDCGQNLKEGREAVGALVDTYNRE
jgi:hypothetical protein